MWEECSMKVTTSKSKNSESFYMPCYLRDGSPTAQEEKRLIVKSTEKWGVLEKAISPWWAFGMAWRIDRQSEWLFTVDW